MNRTLNQLVKYWSSIGQVLILNWSRTLVKYPSPIRGGRGILDQWCSDLTPFGILDQFNGGDGKQKLRNLFAKGGS
jgi:hypothetical protein